MTLVVWSSSLHDKWQIYDVGDFEREITTFFFFLFYEAGIRMTSWFRRLFYPHLPFLFVLLCFYNNNHHLLSALDTTVCITLSFVETFSNNARTWHIHPYHFFISFIQTWFDNYSQTRTSWRCRTTTPVCKYAYVHKYKLKTCNLCATKMDVWLIITFWILGFIIWCMFC